MTTQPLRDHDPRTPAQICDMLRDIAARLADAPDPSLDLGRVSVSLSLQARPGRADAVDALNRIVHGLSGVDRPMRDGTWHRSTPSSARYVTRDGSSSVTVFAPRSTPHTLIPYVPLVDVTGEHPDYQPPGVAR